MKKFRGLISLLCLVMSFTAVAGPISEYQAKSIADGFMAGRSLKQTILKLTSKAPSVKSAGSAAYYVFNNETADKGFVIVAGDDRAPAVLGYSDEGSFDSGNLPDALQELLRNYVDQIAALDEGGRAAKLRTGDTPVSPLVSATWSQNNPYNVLFPILSNGKHAYVGCVATAMAQVMYYWKWPERPTMAIPAYTTLTLSIPMPELPVTDFAWTDMQDTYLTSDTTSAAALAASTLSLYCSQSVGMNFRTTGSGATTAYASLALSKYFGYSAATHTVNRANYTTQQWNDLLYNEMLAGRPVIYDGSNALGGHAFICDGYDGNGMFHINWGWNGMHNGYYLLNVLNPEQQSSADGTYGFITSQTAIVGIEPDNGTAMEFELTAGKLVMNSFNGTRTSSSGNFSANVTCNYYNYTSQEMDVSYGWGLFQDEAMISNLYSANKSGLAPGSFLICLNRKLSFGSNLADGIYRLKPIYSEKGANNWRPCVGAGNNFIEVTIDGNTCDIVGHGTAGNQDYTVNDIAVEGNMHNGRPVNVTMNLTNNGESCNELMYMFAGKKFVSTAFVSLEKGETGNLQFCYVPDSAAVYTLKFSFNNDGSDPIATRDIVINEMPAADLSAGYEVLNVTDASGRVVTGNEFSIVFNITNNGTSTYDEDISSTLFKHTHDNSGSRMQSVNKHITLAAGETASLRFDFDNVTDGWKYFVQALYYSSGEQIPLVNSGFYTIVFPETPDVKLGDVDGNGEISIVDVTLLIEYLLGGDPEGIILANADVDGDSDITINDVTRLINLLLNGI